MMQPDPRPLRSVVRPLLLALALAAGAPVGPARAEVSLAPPGPCAGELAATLQLPPAYDEAAALAAAAGAARLRFSPAPVAAAPDPISRFGAPTAVELPARQPCDAPGSGCMGPVTPAPLRPRRLRAPVVVAPPPSSPCGGPGFPCP